MSHKGCGLFGQQSIREVNRSVAVARWKWWRHSFLFFMATAKYFLKRKKITGQLFRTYGEGKPWVKYYCNGQTSQWFIDLSVYTPFKSYYNMHCTNRKTTSGLKGHKHLAFFEIFTDSDFWCASVPTFRLIIQWIQLRSKWRQIMW